jgi:hypothetical protein
MAAKIKIQPASTDRSKPESHLQPILDYLARAGNAPVDTPPFRGDKAGFAECQMRGKINWDDVAAHFELPPGITIDKQLGALHDHAAALVIVEAGDNLEAATQRSPEMERFVRERVQELVDEAKRNGN